MGEHHCGYTAFTVDLTDNVLYGQDNLLCVRLDSRENLNVPPFGYVIDYMTYGGIYRDVRLEVKEKVSLSDIFVHTAIDFRSSPVTAQITSEITLTESDENVTIRQYYMPKIPPPARDPGIFCANKPFLQILPVTRRFLLQQQLPILCYGTLKKPISIF